MSPRAMQLSVPLSPSAVPIPTALTGKKALGCTRTKTDGSTDHVDSHTSAALVLTAWTDRKKIEDAKFGSQASKTDAKAQASRTDAKAWAAAATENKCSSGKNKGAHEMDGVAQMVTIPPLAANNDGFSECGPQTGKATRGAGIDVATAMRVQSALAAMSTEGEGRHRKNVVMRELDDIAQMMCPADVEPMSIGSMMHRSNTCKPCIFWTRGICTVGRLCKYCHHLHTGNTRFNAQRRARARARQQALENIPTDAPQLMVWSGKDWQSKLLINL